MIRTLTIATLYRCGLDDPQGPICIEVSSRFLYQISHRVVNKELVLKRQRILVNPNKASMPFEVAFEFLDVVMRLQFAT